MFLSRYHFPIYLMHTIFTAGVRILMQKAGMHNYWLHVAVGMLAGIAAPIFIAKIMEKTGWMNIVLYPSQTVKKLKQRAAAAR